jgi:hypothetical protein
MEKEKKEQERLEKKRKLDEELALKKVAAANEIS